jgi:hypothetical protein
MTNILADNIYPHGLYISELKTYSIWVKDGDYQYIILKKVGWERFLNTIEEKISFWSRIKHKLNV